LNKHNFLEYETVITPYPDLNEKVIIYIKSGKEKILKKLEDDYKDIEKDEEKRKKDKKGGMNTERLECVNSNINKE
jgi:hypothetical protein